MCMENMPWVVQWYRDGCNCSMKDAKMCMMIRGAANRLWWMKIRKNRQFTITLLSLHFPQILWSLLHKIASDELKFRKLCARWVPKMLTEEHKLKRQASALDFLTQYSEEGNNFLSHVVTKGQDIGVTHNPWFEAPVHGVEAHFIANKDEIQAENFSSEDHVHSVLGQKRHSACGLLAWRLHNQRRCLLQHT